jgi:exo-beta-1,3-glucanase (GH17 family)
VKHFLLAVIAIMALIDCQAVLARKQTHPKRHAAISKNDNKPLQCAAFSPYVGKLSPDYGAPPSKELINELLDKLIEQTPFRCIMTYGILNGLDAILASAEEKKLKVIAIIWLDKDTEINTQSITKGIEVAKAYPKTIIKLSCGSEVRTRHGNKFDGEISRCIDSLHKAEVKQPITTIDTWWEWCNRATPCQQTSFATSVDWIGTNIFPWWENKHSGLFPCVPAEKAADFHIERLEEIRKTYPEKDVIITEFGWPNAPDGGTETNEHTGQHCGVSNASNQKLVIQETFKKLAELNWSGVVFESFSESWKPSNEGDFGSSWGICRGTWPYGCIEGLLGTTSAKIPKNSKKP